MHYGGPVLKTFISAGHAHRLFRCWFHKAATMSLSWWLFLRWNKSRSLKEEWCVVIGEQPRRWPSSSVILCCECLVSSVAVSTLAAVVFHYGRRWYLYRFLTGFPLINRPTLYFLTNKNNMYFASFQKEKLTLTKLIMQYNIEWREYFLMSSSDELEVNTPPCLWAQHLTIYVYASLLFFFSDTYPCVMLKRKGHNWRKSTSWHRPTRSLADQRQHIVRSVQLYSIVSGAFCIGHILSTKANMTLHSYDSVGKQR
jgi:hypothetical protein